MCIACHYKGDNGLVWRENRAAAHGDGDYRCVRLQTGRRERCVDCGIRLDPDLDVHLIGGQMVTDHLCGEVLKVQVFGTRSTRYGDQLRARASLPRMGRAG